MIVCFSPWFLQWIHRSWCPLLLWGWRRLALRGRLFAHCIFLENCILFCRWSIALFTALEFGQTYSGMIFAWYLRLHLGLDSSDFLGSASILEIFYQLPCLTDQILVPVSCKSFRLQFDHTQISSHCILQDKSPWSVWLYSQTYNLSRWSHHL